MPPILLDIITTSPVVRMNIYQVLINTHIFPNNSELMRNHLAYEVLDDNMLQLMLSYKKSLKNPNDVQGAILLLQQISKFL